MSAYRLTRVKQLHYPYVDRIHIRHTCSSSNSVVLLGLYELSFLVFKQYEQLLARK